MITNPRRAAAIRKLKQASQGRGLDAEIARKALREAADYIDDKTLAAGMDDPDERWRLDANGSAKW